MTAMLDEQAAPQAHDIDEVNHIICHCDENTALCGGDVTDVPWRDDGVEPVCEPCDQISDDRTCCGADCPVCDAIAEREEHLS